MTGSSQKATAFINAEAKNSIFQTQLKTIFAFLQENVATSSMIAAETGIPQKNICRYKRDLEKAGLLWEVKKDICKTTGFNAWYLTTDPAKAPFHQYNLFEYGNRE